MEDPTFNALWAMSERALAEIAHEVGADPRPHRAAADRIVAALDGLYVDELGLYGALDVRAGTLVRRATVNGIVPLILGRSGRSGALLRTLRGPSFLGGGALLVPSYDLRARDVDPSRYWRGPAWFNMSWLVIEGLLAHGEPRPARWLTERHIALAARHLFPEYVHPLTGAPHGARRFGWTAALTLDLLERRGAGP